VTALVVKHVVAFAFVAAGAMLWARLRRKVSAVRAELAAAPHTRSAA
jgi:hypothetical protein